MDKELFESQIKNKREENIEPLVDEALKVMLANDIRLGDSVYIYSRVLQLVNETIQKLDFKNAEIEKARRAFLDVLIDGMQGNMFTIADEITNARKEIKKAKKKNDKERKKKAVAKLSELERVRDNNPKDVTEERYIECEPTAQHLAKVILSKEWLLKDDNYVKKAIEFDNELLIVMSAMGYTNLLFDKVGHALEQSYIYASEKFWDEPKRKVRLSKIDKQMKQ